MWLMPPRWRVEILQIMFEAIYSLMLLADSWTGIWFMGRMNICIDLYYCSICEIYLHVCF